MEVEENLEHLRIKKNRTFILFKSYSMRQQKITKIMFAWFGSVSFVMIQALSELFKQKKELVEFIILSRNKKFENNFKDINIKYTLILEKDFTCFFENTSKHMHVDFVINTSIPTFNNIIAKRCIHNHTNYVDLCSIIEEKQFKKTAFDQDIFSEAYKKKWLMGIINIWISPGITELLIGYIIKKYDIKAKSIQIHLDENFNSYIPLFSRSPKLALDELVSDAYYIHNKKLEKTWPFHNVSCCNDKKHFNYYRVSQEEIISLKQSYPDIDTIEMFAWGAEIEQIRFLHNIGLLSKEKVGKSSLLDIVKSKLPNAAQKYEMIDAWERGFIDDAWFKAKIDIFDKKNNKTSIKIVFDFNAFKKIQNTVYQWATSISYPTWLWAASMLMLSKDYGQPGIQNGVTLGKNCPDKAISSVISFLKKHLISIDIEREK